MAKKDKKDKKDRAEYAGFEHGDEIKRLNRVIGQVEGVQKMLEDQRKLEDVLTQCKAIHSALKSVESRIIKAHVEVVLSDAVKFDKKKDREEKVLRLEELFRQAS